MEKFNEWYDWLTNAGLVVKHIDNQYITIEDPACIFTAFNTFLEYAWILILVMTVVVLFGWGVLYIKNGAKLNSLSDNFKYLVLVLGILSVAKPIINTIYGDNLLGRLCETKQIPTEEVQKLLDMREQNLNCPNCNNYMMFEDFNFIDSGAAIPEWLQEESEQGMSDPTSNLHTMSAPMNASHAMSGPMSSSDIQQHNNNISSYVTLFVNPNGELMQHINGSRAWRNNNPGNIRSSSGLLYGANGVKNGFLVFPDEQTGLNAISQLFRGKNYKPLSLRAAMYRYAPAADKNVPEKYAQNISKLTGVSVTTKMGDMSDQDLRKIALAIKKIEGWKPGIEEKL